jgi:anti-sigma factor ChrR (cupin superfamily)
LVLPDLLAQSRRPDFTWSELRPGVDEHRLHGGHDGNGPIASILRYAPGARVPYHRHGGHEHIFVLSGSQRDERGTYGAGTLVINTPESRHDVVSDDGCTVLSIWERPVTFVEPGDAKPDRG